MARGDIRGVVLALGRCRRRKMRMGLVRMGVYLAYWRRYIAGHLAGVGARVGYSHELEEIRVAFFQALVDNDLTISHHHHHPPEKVAILRSLGCLGNVNSNLARVP